jgi:hypothetical protein
VLRGAPLDGGAAGAALPRRLVPDVQRGHADRPLVRYVADPDRQRAVVQPLRGHLFDYYLFRGAFGPFGALFPLPRPARTIVALVMFTASRSAVSAMWA